MRKTRQLTFILLLYIEMKENLRYTLFVILFFGLVISCTSNSKSERDIISPRPKQNRGNSAIEHFADSTSFSLDILNNDIIHDYFLDGNKKCRIVITEEIQSLDKFFATKNIVEAIKYHNKNNKNPEKNDIRILTQISIQKKDGNFEDICFLPNEIYPHEDGTFGVHEFEMTLNETIVKSKVGASQKMLQVIIKLDEKNKRTYLINFMYKQNSWKLVSRERYSNSFSDIEKGERYCIDTTNNCSKSGKKVELSFDCLLHFDNGICN
jgi:hypothetical protein